MRLRKDVADSRDMERPDPERKREAAERRRSRTRRPSGP